MFTVRNKNGAGVICGNTNTTAGSEVEMDNRIRNCVIANCTAEQGSAIYVTSRSANVTLHVENCVIHNRTGSCTCGSGQCNLVDRTGSRFPVVRDGGTCRSVVFDCGNGSCTCSGCWVEGEYVCDGVTCALPTAWCGCYGGHGTEEEEDPPTTPHQDMASAPSVSATFDSRRLHEF